MQSWLIIFMRPCRFVLRSRVCCVYNKDMNSAELIKAAEIKVTIGQWGTSFARNAWPGDTVVGSVSKTSDGWAASVHSGDFNGWFKYFSQRQAAETAVKKVMHGDFQK